MKKFLSSRLGIIIVTGISIALLITAQRIGVLRPVENVVTAALVPVQDFFSAAARNTKGLTGYFADVKNLRQENEELRTRIAELTDENLRLENAVQDAAVAAEELAFINQTTYRSVTGKVIGRSADEYLRSVIINKGDRHDIQIGSPVTTSGGILIGTVIDTNSTVSKVLLLNDNQSEVSAVIQNDQRSPGIVSGEFGLSLQMTLIPQQDQIAAGQTVITSGLEEFIPADLIIGTITEVQKKEGALFQSALIQPLIDYDTIRIVSVILPFND